MSINFPASLRYQSLLFEQPLTIKVQIAGFQNREDEVLLEEGGHSNVRYWYMSTGLSKFASYSMSINLPASFRYQSLLFEQPLIIKVQIAGFQNREDEVLLEEGGHSNVRYWYMSTGLSKFASYSMSINLPASFRYQSLLFEQPLIIKVQIAGFQNREDEVLLEEGGHSNVRYWYMSTGLSKFASYSMSINFPASLRYQSLLFEQPRKANILTSYSQ
ncbi:hypothetical protein [Paenibacillus endoradicis]|uniref:hypothetical protein n=1 Tax=Paenibacillus endoradicis TaxID=2972487 RepID=UPI002158D6ED|nr:hypothetical protein [Paenibacillus endoradicis]MCR8660639.1 hypothetical protein [Paenibacillus endoradicis]